MNGVDAKPISYLCATLKMRSSHLIMIRRREKLPPSLARRGGISMQRLSLALLSHVSLLYLRRNLESEMTFCAPESRNMRTSDVALPVLGKNLLLSCSSSSPPVAVLSVNRRNYSG